MDKNSFWKNLQQAEQSRFRMNGQTFVNMPKTPNGTGRKIGRGFLAFLLLLLLVITVFNSYYTLSVNEVGVLTTFGAPESVTTTGIHLKIPYVQQIHKISREIHGMEIGYDTSKGGQSNPSAVREDSEMITNDFNFVNVDFYIEYQVTDPIRMYVNRSTAESILNLLAKSYIRDTVGVYNVDDVITTGRAEIQAKVKEKLSERLEREDIGLGIVNVTIQDAEPPTSSVQAAFKAVEDAKQGMDTKINEARKYQSEQLPAANAAADKSVKAAEAYKQQRINEAEGQAARFNDMYAEYTKYPLITKKRMFYETMENVLPSLKVIITGNDGTQTMLPLEPFSGTVNSAAAEGGKQK